MGLLVSICLRSESQAQATTADTFNMGVSSSSCLQSKHFTTWSHHPSPSQYKINIKTLPAYSRVFCSTEPHYFNLTRWYRTSPFEHGGTERYRWTVVCRQECTGVTTHSRMLDRLTARYLQQKGNWFLYTFTPWLTLWFHWSTECGRNDPQQIPHTENLSKLSKGVF